MAHTISRTEQLDPRTLLVDVNVRSDVQLDQQFVGTIKDHGVLVPIVAVDTTDGVRVRFGHRRTLAAAEAGLDTVPVIVVHPDSSDPDSNAAEIDRLITQHVENTHRAGLTTAEEVGVARQLAAFGLSVNQIARLTRTKRGDVARAVAVAESELAAKATERYDLTLEQAATLAEFDDEPETVKTLVAAAKVGQFDHVAQQARDDRTQIAPCGWLSRGSASSPSQSGVTRRSATSGSCATTTTASPPRCTPTAQAALSTSTSTGAGIPNRGRPG